MSKWFQIFIGFQGIQKQANSESYSSLSHVEPRNLPRCPKPGPRWSGPFDGYFLLPKVFQNLNICSISSLWCAIRKCLHLSQWLRYLHTFYIHAIREFIRPVMHHDEGQMLFATNVAYFFPVPKEIFNILCYILWFLISFLCIRIPHWKKGIPSIGSVKDFC